LLAIQGISIWGDSIGRGIVFDEQRGRYTILRDNCVKRLAGHTEIPFENRASMGNTTEECLKALDDSYLREGWAAVIEFGGNDCDMPWSAVSADPGAVHEAKVPPGRFRAALAQLVDRAKGAGMVPVLIVPPPLDAERYFSYVSRGLNSEAIMTFLHDVQEIFRWQAGYAEIVRDAARALGVSLLDIRRAFTQMPRVSDYLCPDGIHPNAGGHELMYNAALPCLQKVIAAGQA
jgi:acyl-CoA thioesterase I